MIPERDDRQFEAAVGAIEAELIPRCEACGVEKRPGDPIVCRVCGEPVLGDGWTP